MGSNQQIFNLPRYKQRRQHLRNNATVPERTLWQLLRGKQLGVKFRRQHGIGHYIVDFYCPERRLVIELDGESHSSDTAQDYDRQRDNYLNSLGLRVIRFTNEQLAENPEGVYAIIHQAVIHPS